MSDNRCKLCGRKLKNWQSIQRGLGPVCERKYLEDIYSNQQITFEDINQKKGEVISNGS